MRNNKKKMILVSISIMILCCINGCGLGRTSYVSYKFETYEGKAVTIDKNNIVSQEKDFNALETTKVPEGAEVIAPGRDYVYLADEDFYYVEDAENNLVTKARK